MTEVINYNSPLGIIQIKNCGDFISEVSFGEAEEKREIIDENKKAEKERQDIINNRQDANDKLLKPQSEIIKECISQLDEYFSGKRFEFNLELLQPGTPFQQGVWERLQKIKYGNTLSYLSFSKQLGNAKAIRAVGTANGKNNIAIIVPCHRVIGSNGSLVGYAGDLWRKKWLLNHEAKFAHGLQTLF